MSLLPAVFLFMLLLLLCSSNNPVYAQTRKTVVGIVTDEANLPIPGVSVVVKETKATTQTDSEGRFKVQASPAENIEFSYIGFQSQTLPAGKDILNIVLKASTTTLKEVVAIGYGTIKRSDLTGAVGSVIMKDLEKAPVKSFDQALAGRVAGVQVTTGDGQPGNVADIVIRGAGSISQDNSPLYVIDGFPTESSGANTISPSDIESIDILKDASATAIYGARGSNGVVLITTKRGKIGTPKINYNAYYGVQKAPATIPVMDSYEFVRLLLERDYNNISAYYLGPGVTLDSYRNATGYNWQDYIYQTGQNQNHDIAIRGGADKTTYALSANYNNQQGVIKHSGFKRYQGRLVLDQNISRKIRVGINSNLAYTEQVGMPVNATNYYASAGFLYSVWGYRPTTSLIGNDSNTDLLNSFYDPANDNNNAQDYRVNPVINLDNQKTKYKTTTIQTNGYGEYSITPKLKLRLSAGINSNERISNIFNNSQTQSGSKWGTNGPNGSYVNSSSFSLVNDNTLTYKNTFNRNHNLTLVGGYSTQSNKSNYQAIVAKNITDEAMELDALDMVDSKNLSVSSVSSRWTLQSFFGRANYDYKGRYLLTATFRADGSSKFAPNHKWGYFPSASAAWKFSQEDFFKNIKWLSDGKLRIGYGESGNNRVSDFAYASQANLTNVQYWYSSNNLSPAPGLVITTADNRDLKWETNKQTNIGLDLSFLKKRITLTTDIYKRVTDDLLLEALLPYAMGLPSAVGFKNIGSLENRGLEITVGTTNIKNKNFTWSTDFNISFNKNKILALTEGTNTLTRGSGTFFDTNFASLSPYISVKGRSIGEMYGLIFDGVYQYSDFNRLPDGSYSLKSNIPTNGSTAVRPGDIKYKDLNGDLAITADDYTIIGRGLPIHTGGLSNNFTYKNWDLNIFMQWSYGNNIINANRYLFEGGITSNLYLNQFASYANRWTPTNPSNEMFRVGGMGSPNYSSRVVEDGSYLRVKTVQLGYNFSNRTLKTIGLSKLNVNVSAQNLLTFTNYSGLDPEASARPGNLTPGFDYGTYPQAKTITFGINANF